jgi:hypothetical protein
MSNVMILKEKLSKLTGSDATFAGSLVKQFEEKNQLSQKQWYWVGKMIEKADKGVQEPVKVEVGSMTGLISMLQTASKHLKHPKIRMKDAEGNPVAVSLSGPKSKTPGYVQVTDGGPFKNNVWYGRVSPSGVWEQTKSEYVKSKLVSVKALLVALSEKPAETASAYGKLTGRCCFCNGGLSDPRSAQVGYGPVCAKHYGLPWGKFSKEEHDHAIQASTEGEDDDAHDPEEPAPAPKMLPDWLVA